MWWNIFRPTSHYSPLPAATTSATRPLRRTKKKKQTVMGGVHLASILGGTDMLGYFSLGNPTLPVRAGHLQCLGLGMGVCACKSGDGGGDRAEDPGAGSSRVAARGEMGGRARVCVGDVWGKIGEGFGGCAGREPQDIAVWRFAGQGQRFRMRVCRRVPEWTSCVFMRVSVRLRGA